MLPNKVINRKTSAMTVLIFVCDGSAVAAVVPGQVCLYVIIKS